MSTSDWTHIDSLFAAALEHPPERRASFLREVTSDNPALMSRVMALLDSMDTSEQVIGESAYQLVSAPVLDPPADDTLPAGTRLGAYEVLEEIGRGGMGRVYRAARADAAFERAVAIKVMARSVASETVVRRFAAERRVLASLEHPNIARLYDGGVVPDGRPYLVMEYVAGARLDRHVAERALELDQRLQLFESVCDAVAFAHRRLIVHRDLKPANILVTADGRVVLLDFGIAKLLGDDAESTRAGHHLFTPEYASPEHLRDDAASVAMDVYSLGVILHELLTGQRPSWQGLIGRAADAMTIERAMRAPSETVRHTAVPHEGAPRAIAFSRLRGDLDTIVLTALAPESVRRYASVEALRDDVRRFRSGYPILARSAPVAERLVKFVRRNRALATVGTLALLLAVVYGLTVAAQSRRLARERDRTALQAARADQVAAILVDLFGATDPFARGRRDTVRLGDFVEASAARLQGELARQPVVQGSVFTVLGRALRRLGRNDAARVVLGKAERALRDSAATAPEALAESLHELGQLAQDETRREDAERYYREALALIEHAPSATPSRRIGAMLPVATMLAFRGQLDSAAVILDSADAGLARLVTPDSALRASYLLVRGDFHYRSGEAERAVSLMQEAVALNRARLGADHPRVLLDQGNLAFSLTTTGRNKEAIATYLETIDRLQRRLGRAHPTIVEYQRTLAAAYSRDSQFAAAESTMRQAVADARLLGASSTDLAETLDAFGQFMERVGREREAESAYRESAAIHRRVYGAAHPVVAIGEARLASVRCRSTPSDGNAERQLRAAVRSIDAAFPSGEPVRMKVHSDLGLCLAHRGQVDAARAELQSNFDAAVARRGPAHPMVQNVGRALAEFHLSHGDSAAAARVRQVLAGPTRERR